MAWETFDIYGKSVQVFVRETNLNNAESALSKVAGCQEPVEEFINLIEAQKAEIPEHYGEKDELGENIETYLTEIQDKVKEKITANLDSVIDNGTLMKQSAYNKDKDNAYYDYKSSHPKPKEEEFTLNA